MKRFALVFALIALVLTTAAGCDVCTTNRFTTTLPLGPAGEPCETTCQRALTIGNEDDDFISCRFGLDDQQNRSVLCTFEYTYCPQEIM